ncbi:MAG: hypothetical protein ACREK6_07905 [Candidatus Rokuibacteriota bacterium]
MSRIEQVLNDEINQLLERLSDAVPAGCLEATASRNPVLRRRLDEVEGQMASVRAALLDSYGRWRRSLDDLENIWALAGWKAAGEDIPYRDCA